MYCSLYFIAAYSEVGWVASNIEDNITGAEVQEVLVLHSLLIVSTCQFRRNGGDFFREHYLCILVNSKQ